MKLALHRSVTFWSGILVMAFICWAWRDSAHHVASCYYSRDPIRAVSINLWNSAINAEVRYTEELAGYERGSSFGFPSTGPSGFWSRGLDESEICWFPAPEFGVTEDRAEANLIQRVSYCSVPLWLVLVCYLTVWMLSIWWRARRRKRAMAP